MNKAQLKAVCEPTRLMILGLLTEEALTNTEIYDKLKKEGIEYRESVFKALKKLMDAGLVKRVYYERMGYKYSLNFEELKVGSKLRIKT